MDAQRRQRYDSAVERINAMTDFERGYFYGKVDDIVAAANRRKAQGHKGARRRENRTKKAR